MCITLNFLLVSYLNALFDSKFHLVKLGVAMGSKAIQLFKKTTWKKFLQRKLVLKKWKSPQIIYPHRNVNILTIIYLGLSFNIFTAKYAYSFVFCILTAFKLFCPGFVNEADQIPIWRAANQWNRHTCTGKNLFVLTRKVDVFCNFSQQLCLLICKL